MTGAALWFLLGSGLAAGLTSWRVRSPIGALAVLGAALLMLWATSRLGLGFAGKQVTPLITGAGLAAFALVVLHVAKRDAGLGARIVSGVGAALAGHAFYLWFALSLR